MPVQRQKRFTLFTPNECEGRSETTKGFTLVELLVVVVIIAILSVVGISIFTGVRERANDAKKKADVEAITKAYEVNYDPLTSTYRTLAGSWFASGQIPTPPEGGSYNVSLNAGNTGFQVCAPIGGTTPCSSPSASCFCKQSSQGEFIAAGPTPTPGPTGTPTPTPGPTSTPTPTPTPTPVPGTCPSSGLVAYWKMDDVSATSVADSVGANNGTATGTTVVAGKIGNARSFNGSTDNIYAPMGSYFGLNNPLTVSAWVRATSTTNGPVFGVTNSPPSGGWNMPFLSTAGTTVYGWIWGVNGNSPLNSTVSLNNWHLLTITYDPAGSGLETFYVDGVSVATGTGQYNTSGSFVYFTTRIVGAKPAGVNSDLNGTIDEIGIWSRALSLTDISTLWNGSAGITCP